jgi:hypothetical protein
MSVRPLLIGPANALACTGFSWRWCRDHAAELGVRFVGAGRKRAIVASEFLAALAATTNTGRGNGCDEQPVEIDAAEEIRKRMGLRVVGGGR